MGWDDMGWACKRRKFEGVGNRDRGGGGGMVDKKTLIGI